MKKLATLLLAAGMVFGAATGASAIDFKAKGQWVMEFTAADNSNFTEDGYGRNGKDDNFDARQRVRLQLDAVASEALSGTVYFEMGDQVWGNAKTGGALGADGKVVEVKQAYIDWIVPNTDLKLRMGLQGIKLPNFANGSSQILDDDMAGITASYAFNENVAVTAFWARLYNDNYAKNAGRTGNYLDNADMFALLVPMTFDGVKVTPWVAYAALGKNVLDDKNPKEDMNGNPLRADYGYFANGVKTYGAKKPGDVNAYADFIAAGLTGEITMADPFRFAWDFNYASLTTGDDHMKRQGWFGTILGEYKMDWGTPGLYAWYASGEDGDSTNGSERMPFIHPNGTDGYSNLASTGNKYLAPNEALLGKSWQGTWGIGARIKDVSFLEGLKHTFRVNFIQGTNDKDAVRDDKNLFGAGTYAYNLSTDESALEIGLSNSYKVYENLDFYTDISYLALWQDEDLRGGVSQADAWNVTAAFVYSF